MDGWGEMNKLILAILSASLMSACSAEYSLTDSNASSARLEGSALAYSQTLYPIIQDNCSLCHETIQSPFFAFRNDIQTSHDYTLEAHLVNFIDIPSSDLARKVRDGHNCWTASCEGDAQEIEAAIEEWGELRGDTSTGTTYRSAAVTIPSNLTSSNTTLSLSLTGIAEGVPTGAVVEIDARLFNSTHYQFSTPRIKTSSPIQVSGVSVIINSFNPDPTSAFSLVNTSVPALGTPPGSTAFTLSNSAALIEQAYGITGGGPGVDQIQIQFSTIGDVATAAEQRFAAFLSVVKTQCSQCHNIQRTFTFNGQVRVVPPFANFTNESQFLNQPLGFLPDSSARYLVTSGNATNSAMYRAVAQGVNGNAFTDVNRAMPLNIQAAQRAPMAATIQAWIDGLDD